LIDTDYNSATLNQVLQQVPVTLSGNPAMRAIYIDPAGKYGYFSANNTQIKVLDVNSSSGTYLQVVGSVTGTLTATLQDDAAFTPDGKRLWWLEDGSFGSPSLIAIVNTDSASSSFQSLTEFTMPSGFNPQGISFSTDGSKAFVGSWGTNVIRVLNTSTLATITDIPNSPGTAPRGVALSPDGSSLVTSTDGGSYLVKYDPNSYVSQGSVTFDAINSAIHYVKISNDSQFAYIPGQSAGNVVHVVNIAPNPMVKLPDIPVGSSPMFLAVHP
jgi:DNA-binding beta-propeller fold protein YncE